MPSLFRLFGYTVFFWSNEGNPTEPIHVHVARGKPTGDATKIWLTEAGGCVLANNNSHISPKDLNVIMEILAARQQEIKSKWLEWYGDIHYYV